MTNSRSDSVKVAKGLSIAMDGIITHEDICMELPLQEHNNFMILTTKQETRALCIKPVDKDNSMEPSVMQLEAWHIGENPFKQKCQSPWRHQMLPIHLPTRGLMNDEDATKLKADKRLHVLLFIAIKLLRHHRSTHW